jgi:ParB-like chromosome segregation protein Spo0J
MKTSRHLKGSSSGMHLERRMKHDSVRYHDIKPHPLCVKVYGKPKPSPELLTSIEKVGMLQPVIVNKTMEGRYLLAGATRREAWEVLYKQGRVKSAWMPCRFVSLPPLEAERIIIESNRQRVKTKAQVAREASELLRIERALGQLRMKAGKPNPREKLPTGRARDVVGKVLGVSGKTVEKMAAVAEKADEGIPAARAAMEALDKNEISVDAAFREV